MFHATVERTAQKGELLILASKQEEMLTSNSKNELQFEDILILLYVSYKGGF